MKPPFRFLSEQLLLAQHHLNDAESAKSKEVLDSSIHDTEESVQRMRKVLPPQMQIGVKAEQHRKEASLADTASSRKVPHMDTKTLLKQAQEAEQIDRANAFELAFAKMAQDCKLDESTYEYLRKRGMDLLAKEASQQERQEAFTASFLKAAEKSTLPAELIDRITKRAKVELDKPAEAKTVGRETSLKKVKSTCH